MLQTLAKQAGRAQEKVKQKLGKADETVDESFNNHVRNNTKQNAQSAHILKEAQHYLKTMQAMAAATNSLLEALFEAHYDEERPTDQFGPCVKEIMRQYTDLQDKISDQLINPMSLYVAQFPEIKKKIEKRDRKLIDYDRYRHALDSTRAKQKVSEKEIQKAEEQHATARQLYEEINDQLNAELPAFYEDRKQFYHAIFHTVFTAEAAHHQACADTYQQLHGIGTDGADIDSLVIPASSRFEAFAVAPSPAARAAAAEDDGVTLGPNLISAPPPAAAHAAHPQPRGSISSESEHPAPLLRANSEQGIKPQIAARPPTHQVVASAAHTPIHVPVPAPRPAVLPATVAAFIKQHGSRVVKKVRATHPYDSGEDDELQFKKGDLIYVVQPEAGADEVDDGWDYGLTENVAVPGVFPLNFTEPYEEGILS